MKKVLILFGLLALTGTGCASNKKKEHQDHYSYVRFNTGVKVTPAIVSNPAPVCESSVQVARLDKVPELQVFVDVERGGSICKSARF